MSTRAQDRAARKRATGPCPIMRSCGGCAWLGMPYHKQLARKQDAMVELFGGLFGRLGWHAGIDPIVGMRMLEDGARERPGFNPLADAVVTTQDGKLPAPRGFRHKAATPFAPGPKGSLRCGFFARGTHTIVEAPTCAVEAPGAREILRGVARAAQSCGIPAYAEDVQRGMLRHAIVRMGWRSDEAMLTVVSVHRDLPRLEAFIQALSELSPRLSCIAQNVNPRPGNAILGPETSIRAGSPRMRDRLLGCTFEISPTAFYQTNPQQTEVLYQLAIDGMDLHEGDVLLDTYCGSGTIGLAAAQQAREHGVAIRLVGVERNAAGIDDARENALVNDLSDQSSFIAEDATSFMLRAASEGAHVDVLAMDPPRAGSTPEFIRAAASVAPRRIVYISCNPVTQARDLEAFAEVGYRLSRLTPVDMFPHTDHVETVATLER